MSNMSKMSQQEKILRRQIIMLESEIESLRHRLQLAEELNWKAYKENQNLTLYVRAMEKLRNECSDCL